MMNLPCVCENGQVDLELAKSVEKVQGLGLICSVSCHLLQLLPDGQNLVLTRHSVANLENTKYVIIMTVLMVKVKWLVSFHKIKIKRMNHTFVRLFQGIISTC